MIDDKYRLLIHRAIDGELTEPERAELDPYLASSAEARHFYQQVEAFASIPSHLPQVEAPASIRAEVLHRIARGQHESRSRKSNPREIGALIGSLLTPRLAYGLAAGLIIGIAIGATTFKQPGNQVDPLDVSGTILGGKESGVLTRLDADAFSDEQMRGQLSVDTKGDLTYLQVELQSSQELSIVIDFDPNAYVFRAFEQRSPQPSGLVTDQGQIRSSHAGENRYLFVFGTVGKAASPVVLRVESTGVSYQRELTFGDEAGS